MEVFCRPKQEKHSGGRRFQRRKKVAEAFFACAPLGSVLGPDQRRGAPEFSGEMTGWVLRWFSVQCTLVSGGEKSDS